jgi:hypothetical protein
MVQYFCSLADPAGENCIASQQRHPLSSSRPSSNATPAVAAAPLAAPTPAATAATRKAIQVTPG